MGLKNPSQWWWCCSDTACYWCVCDNTDVHRAIVLPIVSTAIHLTTLQHLLVMISTHAPAYEILGLCFCQCSRVYSCAFLECLMESNMPYYSSISLIHLTIAESLHYIKRLQQQLHLYLVGLLSAVYDVYIVMRSPNNAVLRTYPHWQSKHDCASFLFIAKHCSMCMCLFIHPLTDICSVSTF